MCIIQQSFYRFSMWAWLIWIFARHSHHFINISATIQITVVMITTTAATVTTLNSSSRASPPPFSAPAPRQHITINTKQCAKCGDIHSAFNGNGNYCKSGQPFELYLCINIRTCICELLCSALKLCGAPQLGSSAWAKIDSDRLLLHPCRSWEK